MEETSLEHKDIQFPGPPATQADTTNEGKIVTPIRVLLIDDEKSFFTIMQKMLARISQE